MAASLIHPKMNTNDGDDEYNNLLLSWKEARSRMETRQKLQERGNLAAQAFLQPVVADDDDADDDDDDDDDETTVWSAEVLEDKIDQFILSLKGDPKEINVATTKIFVHGRRIVLDSFRHYFNSLLEGRQARDDNIDDEAEGRGQKMFENLRILGWFSRPTDSSRLQRVLMQSLHSVIEKFVEERCAGEFEEPLFEDVCMEWKESVLMSFIRRAVLGNGANDDSIAEWNHQLNLAISESFCNLRIGELFDIITEFPESETAVSELRNSLARFHTGMPYFTKKLQNELNKSLRNRLLHPGANTNQILDVYISLIKTMGILDDTGVLLGQVSKPVQSYLRNRSDTVRCICTSLTDEESGGDLYEELRRQGVKPLEQANYGSDNDSDDEVDDPQEHWLPKSTHIRTTSSSVGGSKNKNDILAILVGIFGSIELFVEEYRSLLSDKLLANVSFDTDKDVHTLELLKLRFGEDAMHHCEIMMKDLDDSRRINVNISSTATTALQKSQMISGYENDEFVIDATIISHVFWPSLERESLKIYPTHIQDQIIQYGQEFAKLKNPRRLEWYHQLGSVELELFVDSDRPQSFACSPLQATLISHFEDRECWTSLDLANETGEVEDVIITAMNFWIKHGTVRADSISDDSALRYCLEID